MEPLQNGCFFLCAVSCVARCCKLGLRVLVDLFRSFEMSSLTRLNTGTSECTSKSAFGSNAPSIEYFPRKLWSCSCLESAA